MADQTDVTDAPEQAEAPVAAPAKEAAPKQEKPRDDASARIRELQRLKDREVAEARREAKQAATRAAELEGELGGVRGLLAQLREHSNISDDEAARIEALAKKESTLAEREERARSYERTVTIRALSQEYGVPPEELESYDDPKDMQIAALKWDRQNGNGRTVEEEAEEETPPERPERALRDQGNRFDTGSGALGQKSILDMSDEEFSRLREQRRRGYLRRQTGR